jgi:CopG antitoxin of type II toxin-antitoxin system
VPTVAHEAAQRLFRDGDDAADFLDASKALRVCWSNQNPTGSTIPLLRLPVLVLERIEISAIKRDVALQSLIKPWLGEKAGEA